MGGAGEKGAPVSWLTLMLVVAAGPDAWSLPGVRVHVGASEDLEPDRLRALARPEVVLWMTTRSNGLRRSTAETLLLAGSAFVRVHPPLGAPALAPFVGRVGPWVEERDLDVARVRRWSPGRLAVDVEGPFTDAVAARLRVLRPVAVRWARGAWPERDEWMRIRELPGVELSGLGGVPPDCTAVPARTRVRVRLPLASLTAEGVCGLPLRVEVPPTADAVHAMLVAHPEAELAVEVGEDSARADLAARLLDQLVAATPQGPARTAPGAGDAGQTP